jgi:tRNA 2-selenouridine synthase
MDTRIQRLIQEYWFEPSDEAALREMQRIVGHHHLFKKLGPAVVRYLQECLLKHELSEFVHILLKDYYDPLYDHSIQEESSYSLTINTDDMPTALNQLLDFRKHSRSITKRGS